MKRIQLIEIAIIVVALVCGFKAFDSLIGIVIATFYQFAYSYTDAGPSIIQYILLTAIYFGIFLLLVRKRKLIALYIHGQGQAADTDTEEQAINITLYQDNLLFIVIVALCLVTLITEIPAILIGIYDYFKKESSGGRYSAENINFKAAAIKLVVTVIILFYAKPISKWFAGTSGPGTMVATSQSDPE